ncbi:tRNA (adenosine(37)-N6)-threonylcarbamoyltransferase complex dimerization subunit type 1 TsaB [Phyllobacterium sp. A18/5-2]|jgi:tRNA threonylcarbamoyladenosine biosynthesis protein TsaB|uniref:tRNA (adenosine(37)-N6)-threonylcarbamoyltransferase complex dimerization subunit type 1 TsaB n=1 Tax=Phyllobacterium sp. A18/5-2 TaxID=2978392 RepID=UPI000DDFFC2B|nr:tRNA (adenosine(37)-N6)-threonylcarbamoyltransferase complex dimerization subunit type 1 TsaB [Phyllobacterium sp. A18/5-2]UXN62966.1 tRNA (adenosine(37)-N6)-threonylcarbamoyltransferase complex dimerization subunit type 1 TsaB [Phyllobacterium sp. A18/5-2]
MKLLALDTAANLCSVAILDVETGTILAEISEDIGKGHAERLMAVIGQVTERANIAIGEIGKIAVSVGPGSFTGVRVGVSTARGFALALKCPVVGISTLEALACDAAKLIPGNSILSIIDARRGELYAQFFGEDGSALSEPMVTTLPQILEQLTERGPDYVLAGSGAPLVNENLDRPLDAAVKAATGSIEAFARLGAVRIADRESPKPLYLRGLDVKPQQGFVLKRQVTE